MVNSTEFANKRDCDWSTIGTKIAAVINGEEDDNESDSESDDDHSQEEIFQKVVNQSPEHFIGFIDSVKKNNYKAAEYESSHAFILNSYQAALVNIRLLRGAITNFHSRNLSK